MTSVRIAAAPRRGIGTRFGPWVLAASLLSGACSDPEPALRSVDETDGGPNAGVSVDAGLVDAGGAADAGGTADAGTAGLPDLGPIDNGPPAVRFVALGDTGEGNTAQYEVSRAIETVCLVQGCDFALLLGDNFYDHGVDSVDDEQFRAKFEEPYANLQIPFWVTLGNHDFGEVPVQFWRTSYQIEYSMRSWKWNLPDHFYRFVADHVTFVSVDTNMIMLGLIARAPKLNRDLTEIVVAEGDPKRNLQIGVRLLELGSK
ncbi:MAG: metallophosphoesterase, partial [Myxococcota bacterium]